MAADIRSNQLPPDTVLDLADLLYMKPLAGYPFARRIAEDALQEIGVGVLASEPAWRATRGYLLASFIRDLGCRSSAA